ncbi:MAG: hypothetical protein AAF400_00825 [Bacteroidota bacterium]
MELARKPSHNEMQLLKLLVQKAAVNFPPDWHHNLLVQPMNDGGMGSLLLLPDGMTRKERLFGAQISEHALTDEDGVVVLVSLNVDDEGKLFELDIWKTNFDPLINLTLPKIA